MNTQANVITFVTTVTGVAYLRFLRPFLESVFNVYPNGEVLVYYKDIALDRLVGLQIAYPTVAFREQNICRDEDTVAKISGKVRFFYDALRGLRDESRVVFIDCDTLVVRPLDWIFNSSEFDIAVTWKPAGYPLNSGVLLARSTANTKRFLLQWSEQTQELLSDSEKERLASRGFGGADQFTLATLIGRQRTQNCDVSSTEEERIAAYDGAFVAGSQDNCLRVLGVRCEVLNETESRPISTRTHVVHYKSGWHNILLYNGPYTEQRPADRCREMHQYWSEASSDAGQRWAHGILHTVTSESASEVGDVCEDRLDRGMLNSELLLVYHVVKCFGVKRIIESGRWLGHSTEVLARLTTGANVVIESVDFCRTSASIDCERRMLPYEHVRLHYGDAVHIVPQLLAKSHEPTILLIDGPKGRHAVELIRRCLQEFEHITAAFLHDSYVGSEARVALRECFDAVAYTDDPGYVVAFHELDGTGDIGAIHPNQFHGVWEKSGDLVEGFETHVRSYGPTLAMILPAGAVRKARGRGGRVRRRVQLAGYRVAYWYGKTVASLRELKRRAFGLVKRQVM